MHENQNDADSAEIITRVPWGDPAKGFALKSGITLLTFTEKISQLINFTHILKKRLKNLKKEIQPTKRTSARSILC